MNEKPVTYVSTYREVEGFARGLHKGANRDVFITGPESYESCTLIGIVTKRFKEYQDLSTILPKIDEVYIYFGREDTYAGLMNTISAENKNKIKLVACDCNKSKKQQLAQKLGLDIIESECGGRKTLARIVTDLLQK